MEDNNIAEELNVKVVGVSPYGEDITEYSDAIEIPVTIVRSDGTIEEAPMQGAE